jgi:DNA-directed RNA polymerase specialized sigma24 family protein
MKTTNNNRMLPLSASHNRLHSNDTQVQDDFDDLVRLAVRGDRRAVGAIAMALGPMLLDEARVVLGEYADEDSDVLQDFLLVLLEGRSRFQPVHGSAVVWLCRTIRAVAQTRRMENDRRRRDGEE